jgi:hypothetical protein
MTKKTGLTIPDEAIDRRILLARGQKVLLDSDLASLYGVMTKRLNEQVRTSSGFSISPAVEQRENLREAAKRTKNPRIWAMIVKCCRSRV